MPEPLLPAGYCSPRAVFAAQGREVPPTVLLGLSGGADSVTLLHLLLADGLSVAAAHLNHGIRGAEADRDEQFCRDLCVSLGVPLYVERADIPAVCRETGEGTEEAARRIRYAFFTDLMQKEQIRVLCTAHNADDNAETVLLHLCRGTTPRGACGIPPVREIPEGTVLRPILRMSRKEILTYCREKGLSYVTDSTNADVTYARNRIRAKVLPELEHINPEFLRAVTAFTEAERADSAYLDALAAQFLTVHPAFNGHTLAKQPAPVAARALYSLLRQHGASPEHGHIDTLLAGAKEGKRVSVTVPGGYIVTLPPKRRILILKDERKKKNTRNGDTK